MEKIGIIGAGAWGTALAQSLANNGRDVTLWAREQRVVEGINETHENPVFMEGIKLNPLIKATESLSQMSDCDIILLTTPAQHVRTSLQALKGNLGDGKPLVICAKGIELESGLLLSQVVQEEVPDATIAVLTGPTFAREIASGLPSAVTIAADNKEIAQEIREVVRSRTLRAYITDDLIGAQIGGAVKNVIALACGVIVGRELGESARAALLTRGLAEMSRLAAAMGAKKETLMGMCGVGDLMLTCASMQSRNFSMGFALGQGKTLDEIMENRKGKAVTEGVHTAKALTVMARNLAVDMPISDIVYRCLNEDITIEQAIEEMLARPIRSENL